MTRIGATIQGFEQFLLTQLARSNQAIAASAFRVSTGKKYNFSADDPSAFLQVGMWENELSRIASVRENVESAANIGAGMQTALDEIATHLDTIRTALVEDEDNTLTADEKAANQATIDSAIASIRTAARTTIGGKRYLDGSIDYTYSGKNSSQIRNIDVFALPEDTTISGTVTSAATQTVRRYNGPGAKISADATFTLTGKRGSTTISVVNNENLTTVRDRINLDSHLTGIVASVSGSNLDFTTVDYGDAATISISVSSGTFTTSSVTTGADAVVTINGSSIASTNVDGNRVSYNSGNVRLAIDFQAGFSGAFSTVTVSDNQVARFALSTQSSQVTQFGVASLFPETLGGVSGYLNGLETGGSMSGLGTNSAAAIRVVDEALSRLSLIRAQVDGFADITVESAANLHAALESDLEDALDALNTVDEDEEELIQSKYENLSANAVSAITLWQQQQSNFVGLLQVLAGLR